MASFNFKDTIFPNRLQYTTGAFGACEATTDTGTAIKLAQWTDPTSMVGRNALRFIILLSDGAVSTSSPTAYNSNYYACPYHIYTWRVIPRHRFMSSGMFSRIGACQDGDGRTAGVNNSRHLSTSNLYDADDFRPRQRRHDQPSWHHHAHYRLCYWLGQPVIVNPGTGGTQPACNA